MVSSKIPQKLDKKLQSGKAVSVDKVDIVQPRKIKNNNINYTLLNLYKTDNLLFRLSQHTKGSKSIFFDNLLSRSQRLENLRFENVDLNDPLILEKYPGLISIKNLISSDAKPSEVFDQVVPQGVSISLMHRVPMVESLFSGLKSTSEDAWENIKSVVSSANLESIMYFSITGYLCCIIVLNILAAEPEKNPKLNRAFRILGAIFGFSTGYTVTMVLLGGYNLRNKNLNEFAQGFHFNPEWQGAMEDCRRLGATITELPDEDIVDMEELVVPHSFSIADGTTSLIASSFAILTGFHPKDKAINALVNLTKTSSTQTTNISNFVYSFFGAFSKFLKDMKMDEVASYFEIGVSADESINKYVHTATRFIAEVDTGFLKSDAYFSDIYHDLFNKGSAFAKDKLTDKSDQQLLTLTLKNLRSCYERVSGVKSSLNGTRVEPVGVMFRGDPGCMKSVLSQRVGRIVAQMTLPKEWEEDFKNDPKTFLWDLPNDKFFDGYNARSWVAFKDDIFQSRDSVTTEMTDAKMVIGLINTAPFPLPMADVDLKNKFFFRAPFFFATSNIPSYDSLYSVVSPGAVGRRFVLDVQVGVNPKYARTPEQDGRSQLPLHTFVREDIELIGTAIPDDYWTLSVVRKQASETSEPIEITFDDLVYMIVEEHKVRIRDFYVNRDSEKNLVEKFVKTNKVNDQIKNLYSSLYLDTIRPQGASFSRDKEVPPVSETDVPGGYLSAKVLKSLPSESRHQALEICEMLRDSLPYEDSRQLYFTVSELVSEYSLKPDLSYNFDSDILCIMLVNLNMLEDVREYVRTKDLEVFILLLGERIEETIDNNKHPYTMCDLVYNPDLYLEKTAEIVDSATTWSLTIANFFKKHHWFFLLCLPPLIASIYFIYKILYKVDEVISQSADTTRDRGKVSKAKVTTLSHQAVKLLNVTPHASDTNVESVNNKITNAAFGGPSNFGNTVTKIINKNLFLVYVEGNGETYKMGHALNVKGQHFIFPFHFAFKVKDILERDDFADAKIIFKTSTGSTKFDCPAKYFVKNCKYTDSSSKSDLCTIKLPHAHKNSVGIYKNIMTEKDLIHLQGKVNSFRANVIGVISENSGNTLVIRDISINARFHGHITVNADWKLDHSTAIYLVNNTLTYTGKFNKGDCGSLLVIPTNDFANRNVCGMHVAGSPDVGYANTFYKEMIDELLDGYGSDDNYFVVEEEIPEYVTDVSIEAQGFKKPVYSLDSKYIPGVVMKSEIAKSRFYGKLPEPFAEVRHMPSRLTETLIKNENGEEILVDPLMQSFQKYGDYAVFMDPQKVLSATNSYEELITLYCNDPLLHRTVIPLEEALHSFRHVGPIDSSTSPGFPMSLPFEENIKKLYYSAVHNRDINKSSDYFLRIANLVENRIDKYSAGIRVMTFYKSAAKDEVVSLAKFLKAKTRMFNPTDFIYLVMVRMYFGAFLSSFCNANINVGSGIGVNCYSEQWDVLARELLKFGHDKNKANIGAGDYSGYDTTIKGIILWSIFAMIQRWYGNTLSEQDKQIQFMLFVEIVNPCVIKGKHVYLWESGLPSGNPLTALLNTIYNHVLFRLAYIDAGLDVSTFNENVYLIALGDDNTFSVSSTVQDKFNEFTLPALMSTYGAVYTTELKEKALVEMRKLSEVSFLKRSFRFDSSLNRWVAPLDIESIFKPLNWTKRNVSRDQIPPDQIVSSIRELSLHGKQVFDKYATDLVALSQKQYPGVLPNKPYCINFAVVYPETLSLEHKY
nr:MAG: polyprotein 1 [Picornavirales sp.]